ISDSQLRKNEALPKSLLREPLAKNVSQQTNPFKPHFVSYFSTLEQTKH
ncbi:7297_t:CDS:1, partial [Racocetra fulgida]